MKRFALACAVMSLLACSPHYKSGNTKCGSDLDCPSGYVCGAAGTSSAPDVCYDSTETDGCSDSDRYWCPDSQTCWSSKVACNTVVYCPDETASACGEEDLVTSCSSSTDNCTSVSSYSCNSQSTDGSCMTCTRQACCSQLHNCMDQPDCLALDACLGGCSSNDTSCLKVCQSEQCSTKCD